MRRFSKVLPTLVIAMCLTGGVARADFVATAELIGLSEVPPNASPAFGEAIVSYDAANNSLSYTITFQDLLAPATAAHIHFGVPGISGPVIFPFTHAGPPAATSGSFAGTLTAADLIPRLTSGINTFADAIAAIEMGNTYVNIHDSVLPGGEIRGQLLVRAVPEPGSMALMVAGAVFGGAILAIRRPHRD